MFGLAFGVVARVDNPSQTQSLAAWVGNPDDNQYGSFWQNYNTYVVSQVPLFDASGTNPEVATRLVEILQSTTFEQQTTVNGNIFFAIDAEQISQAVGSLVDRAGNSGALVVRLFDSVTGTANQENLSQLWYQLVFVSSETGSWDDAVFTFWATQSYRNSAFRSVAPFDPGWDGSLVQSNLTTDFARIINEMPVAEDFIVLPNNLPGMWQEIDAQPHLGAGGHRDSNGIETDDFVWLPSYYEVFRSSENQAPIGLVTDLDSQEDAFMANDARSGLWNLDGFDRARVRSLDPSAARNQNSWLRSGSNSIDGARLVQGTGGSNGTVVHESVSLRPAIHLDLSELATIANVRADFTNTSAPASTMQRGANTGTSKNFSVERLSGTGEISIDAGPGNIVNSITVSAVGHTLSITPGIAENAPASTTTWTPVSSEAPFAVIQTWYVSLGSRQTVTIRVSNMTRSLSFTIGTTNTWQVTRINQGLPDETLQAEGTYAIVAQAPENTPPGHRFAGWFTQPTLGTQVTNATPVATVRNIGEVEQINRLYARWQELEVNVVRVHYNGALEAPQNQSITFGDSVAVPTTNIPTGAPNFMGWWTQDGTNDDWGSQVSAQDFITLEQYNQGTVHIYAKWSDATTVFVTLDLNHAMFAQSILNTGFLAINELYGLFVSPIPTLSGYEFLGWYTDATQGTRVMATTQVTNETAHTLFARWRPIVHLDSPTIAGVDVVGGTMTWQAVDGAVRYIVRIRTNGTTSEHNVTGTSFDISGLDSGSHVITIIAVNEHGSQSEASTLSIVIPQEDDNERDFINDILPWVLVAILALITLTSLLFAVRKRNS